MTSIAIETDDGSVARPPAHPVPQLQGPFEESMIESVNDTVDHETSMDSLARRTLLLEMPTYERVIAGRWKQKPGERFHPLWKITAQMSFGIHLLAEGMAKSEEQVMKILQSHIDDVDGFLERTTEDFDVAQSDVQERLRYLKLPLEHVEVFDRMLEDRTFRMSIVDGNEKIEHIVDRTSEAMKDSLKDVQKGMEATRALDKYLSDLNRTWTRTTPQHEAVFVAMVGNVEGWSRAFMDLYLQGNKLGKLLMQLSDIVIEMQRRAGVVSRRMLIRPQSTTPAVRQSNQFAQPHYSHRQDKLPNSSRPNSTSQTAPLKPLPTAPQTRLATRHSARTALPRQSPSTEKQAVLHGIDAPKLSGDKRESSNTPPTVASFTSRSSSPTTPMLLHPSISELAANNGRPRGQVVIGPPQPRVKNFAPTELPAEVPEEVLSQAPHSSKSRLSMALGLKGKDPYETRSPQTMTTKSLGSLLKSPRSSRRSVTRKSTGSRDITIIPEASSTAIVTETGNNYVGVQTLQQVGSADSQAPLLRADVYQSRQGLGIYGSSATPISAEDPGVSSLQRNPTLNSPAFTSHPPEMQLGAKPILPGNGSVRPVELPAAVVGATEAEMHHSRQQSNLSSLGEPGPEIDSKDNETLQPEDKRQPSTLLDAIARRTLMSMGQPYLTSQTRTIGVDAGKAQFGRTADVPGSNVITPIDHIAEMEGSSPVLLAPLTFGPVELEAPQQRLILPPRPEVPGKSSAPNPDLTSATISSQSDFFKLPTLLHADGLQTVTSKESETRPAPGHASMPAPVRPKQGQSTRDDRSSLPPRLSRLKIPRKEMPGLSRHRPDLLEHISYTPPESPIHTRSVSEASSHTMRIMIERPSRSLAPPHEAPPPPGPGGRSMVNPDYAAAGAFEGERRSKHSSTGSASSWKKLLSGSTTALSPTGSRPRSSSTSGGLSVDAKSPGVNMMTAGGKDVLWFKGMSRDGVWVSTS